MPRGSAGTSSRCRPTRGSSSSGWRSRTSTPSMGCRPPSRSSRRTRPRRRGRLSGTATEIYDYLRLLWARIGHTFCPVCGREHAPRHGAVGHRHGARAARRHPVRGRLPAPRVRRGHARRRGREPAGAGIRASERRRRHGYQLDELGRRGNRSRRRTRRCSWSIDRLVAGPEIAGAPGRCGRDRVSSRGTATASILFSEPMRARGSAEDDRRSRGSGSRSGSNVPTTEPSRRRRRPQLFSFNNPRGACPDLQRIRRGAGVRPSR